MTVLPGSLDYLYTNGILDHIPYEAYDYGFAGAGNNMINPYAGLKQAVMMNGTQYLDAAKRGSLYNTYVGDTFVKQDMSGYGGNNYGGYSISQNAYGLSSGYGSGYNIGLASYGDRSGYDDEMYIKTNASLNRAGKSFRESIATAASSAKETVMNNPSIWKGLLAAGLIIATPILIIKGRKKPPIQITGSGFWSKFNPVNWFKK